MEDCNAGGGIKFPNGRHNRWKRTYEKKKKSTWIELVDYELGSGTNIAVLRSNFFVWCKIVINMVYVVNEIRAGDLIILVN